METQGRSIAKALSWRLVAFVTTAIVAWLVTGNHTFALGIGAIDSLLKLYFYYLHERIWTKIHWGKERGYIQGGGI